MEHKLLSTICVNLATTFPYS